MRNKLAIPLMLLFAVALYACTDEALTSPDFDEFESLEGETALHKSGRLADIRPVRAMTWNIYVGTNVDVILGAQSPEQI